MHHSSLVAAATSLLLLPSTLAAGLYTKSSPVLQVNGKDYDSLIARSNHTSIVEFYAPWCGHCRNLQPAFEKAAKSLSGLAKVAAVNCDEDANKPFCGTMGVQGFPTLKIVRPGKKPGRPTVEDYQGPRNAKGIVDAVTDKIPNHVTRLKDADFDAWSKKEGPRAVLFTEKGTVSALLKALAIDFLGGIEIGQVRDKEKATIDTYGISKLPTLVLLPGEGQDPVTYNGEMKKEPMLAFLSQAGSPNPDPAPKKPKSSSASKDKNKSSKASSSFSSASASHGSSEASASPASQTAETLEDASNPTASPDPNVVDSDTEVPIKVPSTPKPIQTLHEGLSLQQKCLNDKASTCILALLPESESEDATAAVAALTAIHAKHDSAKRTLFPFYQLPTTNSQAVALRNQLKLGSGVELVATNGKRAWSRHYTSSALTQTGIEAWIDEIRMGDGAKEKLPAALVVPADQIPTEPVKVDWENVEGMNEKLKNQMPEGVEFEFEEIDDVQYEHMMRASREQGEKAKQADDHDEL